MMCKQKCLQNDFLLCYIFVFVRNVIFWSFSPLYKSKTAHITIVIIIIIAYSPFNDFPVLLATISKATHKPRKSFRIVAQHSPDRSPSTISSSHCQENGTHKQKINFTPHTPANQHFQRDHSPCAANTLRLNTT